MTGPDPQYVEMVDPDMPDCIASDDEMEAARRETPECPHCDERLAVTDDGVVCMNEDCCHYDEPWTLDEVRIATDNRDEEGSQRMIERQAERYFYGDNV